jgi:hypothetical protein
VGSPQPLSAALVIGVHLEEASGDPWYAILEAYDDVTGPRYVLGRVTDADELMALARRWLDTVLAGPHRGNMRD